MTNSTNNLRPRNNEFREKIRVLFTGNGLDLGPWHMPFHTPNATTLLCDRYSVEEMRKVFAEFSIETQVELPQSDVVINFDIEGLKIFENDSQDFVIASHLLEHLSQPFLFLKEISRVLKPGGLVLIALPDKRYTFDKSRISSDFNHYEKELESGWVIPDVDHIDDYIVHAIGKPKELITDLDRSVELARSFHVHVFSDGEFIKLLNKMINHLKLPLEFVDGSRTNSARGKYEEFIIILRKSNSFQKKRLNIMFFLKWITRI